MDFGQSALLPRKSMTRNHDVPVLPGMLGTVLSLTDVCEMTELYGYSMTS